MCKTRYTWKTVKNWWKKGNRLFFLIFSNMVILIFRYFFNKNTICSYLPGLKGTSINCRERLEYEANGAQKPLSIRSTKQLKRVINKGHL